MRASRKRTTDALDILYRRFYRGKPARLASLERAFANEEVARALRELRAKSGISQAKLAKLVGTTPSVIRRLEDAEYEGDSLAAARRVAGSLNQRVEIRFVPIRRSA